MSRKYLWGMLALVFVALVLLYLYSDYFGNPKMQDTVADLLKIVVGAVVGAWANQVTK